MTEAEPMGRMELIREVARLRALARQALDALDAEKEPNHERGYDRAIDALMAMLGQRLTPITGENVRLDKLPLSDEMSIHPRRKGPHG
jgi:hypothetical protein